MTEQLNTDHVTGALSQACAASFEAALQARTALIGVTVAYAARLIRDILPTAAAMTVDTEDAELHEVRDAKGKILWYAPASVGHVFNDSLVDDVDDLLRQVIGLGTGGLIAAGWKTAAKGLPYREVQLPGGPAIPGHARAYVNHEGMVCHVHVDLVPAARPSFAMSDVMGKSTPEVRDRVRAAILNSGYGWPEGELTVVMHGTGRPDSTADLAIACAILAAAGHLDPQALKRTVILGELGLDGSVRPTPATVRGIRYADICGAHRLIVPAAGGHAYPVVDGGTLHSVRTLRDALDRLAQPTRA